MNFVLEDLIRTERTILQWRLLAILIPHWKRFSPREEKVLRMRWGLTDGHMATLAEVGEHFAVNPQRIGQIQKKLLAKLPAAERREFLDLREALAAQERREATEWRHMDSWQQCLWTVLWRNGWLDDKSGEDDLLEDLSWLGEAAD